jgi:hypothetical protein
MRLRFLAETAAEAHEAKAAVAVEEEGISKEQVEKRKEADDMRCFVTMETWRNCQLGIGLLVLPRTMRERRRGLVPRADLVLDYLSSDAYNMGVRVTLAAQVDRETEAEEGGAEQTVLPSSTRGRINAWLPLYINAENWKLARRAAPSAFSIIATQFADMFQPIHALKVCSKLMIQSIVKFVLEDQRVSERAVQMYCDVHRLFLQMADEHPEIRAMAEQKLRDFIGDPKQRRRSATSDLGDMIQYLTITDQHSWDSLKEAYCVEALRRSTAHMATDNVRGVAGGVALWLCWGT